MKKSNKRLKVTKESTIGDIAASVAGISNALGAIGETHSLLLKSNEVIVNHLLSIEERKKALKYMKIAQNISPQATAEKSTKKSAENIAA